MDSVTLLKYIYQYFTEKGYRLAVGKTVEPKDKFEVIGKSFVPTITAIILKDEELPNDNYTDIKFCENLEDILSYGRKIRNELIIFSLDRLAEED